MKGLVEYINEEKVLTELELLFSIDDNSSNDNINEHDTLTGMIINNPAMFCFIVSIIILYVKPLRKMAGWGFMGLWKIFKTLLSRKWNKSEMKVVIDFFRNDLGITNNEMINTLNNFKENYKLSIEDIKFLYKSFNRDREASTQDKKRVQEIANKIKNTKKEGNKLIINTKEGVNVKKKFINLCKQLGIDANSLFDDDGDNQDYNGLS